MLKRKRGFWAFICVLFVSAMCCTIVVHATTVADGWSNTVEEDRSETEMKEEPIPIGWGEDEIGDISALETAEMDNISEESVKDFSTNVRTHPRTGETLNREEIAQ